MKILFLNPHLYDSPLLGTLRGLGVATIVCSDIRECELVFKLHATSVSLFVGHDDDGVGMNEVLKKMPRFARTPVILTTSKWTDQQCIEHQATPMGANAYLRMPVDDKEFIHVVDQILSTELSHGKGFNLSDDLNALGPIEAGAPPEVTPSINFSVGGGGNGAIELSVEPAAQDKTRLSSAGITLGSTDATSLSISLVGDSGSAPVVAEIQVEDGATIYGIANPDSGEVTDPDLIFKLDAPALSGPSSPPMQVDDHGLKEFVIDEALNAEGPVATEIIATPIDAISVEAFSPVVAISALTEFSPISDDQPTRVAMPIPDELPREEMSFPSERARTAPVEELDQESLAAMPYLGRDGGYANPLAYREPMDDSVVPGGAANAPDTDTLKKYLYLREQDVTALSAQLRQAREQIGLLEGQLRHERAVSSEFAHLAQEQDHRIDGFEKEKAVAIESAQREYDELKFEMKRRTDKIRVMELQVKEATEATERLKERVRNDIRKIRTREKELENRLEIMKKDSEALLGSREHKIIELKRKLDLMEFNTDLVQDLLEKERQAATELRDRLAKVAQMMRVAGGLLGPDAEAILDSVVHESGSPGVNKDDRTTAA